MAVVTAETCQFLNSKVSSFLSNSLQNKIISFVITIFNVVDKLVIFNILMLWFKLLFFKLIIRR